MKKEVRLLISIPKEKEEEFRNIMIPLLKGLEAKPKIRTAPENVVGAVNYFEALSQRMDNLEKGQGNLEKEFQRIRAKGFRMGTEEVKRLLKVWSKNVFNGLAKVIKDVMKGRAPAEKVKEVPIRATVQQRIGRELGIEGRRIQPLLAVLAMNPDESFGSGKLAEIIYGEETRGTRGRVTQMLKPFVGDLIQTEKKGRKLTYKWKDQEALKELGLE